MKPCWKNHGLTRQGAHFADDTIDRMVDLVRELGDENLARVVLAEALFRVHELSKRTPEFRAKYGKENT